MGRVNLGFESLSGLTNASAHFAASLRYVDISDDVLAIARRCVLDGLGVALAGTEQHGMAPLRKFIDRQGGAAEARLLGSPCSVIPAHLAALWFGTAGHAMDWDDTQLAEGPGRPYGLLMHPTMPPLTAALVLSDFVKAETGVAVSGQRFLTAFCAGFEVGCKIAEAINPDHYMLGFHTSGTIGTFAATAAATNLLGLNTNTTARALGIAASMASGIRANFGTMTKPLHVGKAAQNGINAALLARDGFSANEEALDGRWGYLAIAGRGGEPDLVRDRFGEPFTMISPGVSIKPYPSGVLTHPSMDAMRVLMRDHQLTADDVEEVTLSAGSNVLGPIRFQRAMTELEGKFSFQFLLSAIILEGKAGKAEFTDQFVSSDACQNMQTKIRTRFDQEIEAMGWENIRSRIDLRTKDGRTITQWADKRYRGGPDFPLSDAELQEKISDCAEGLLTSEALQGLFDHVRDISSLTDVSILIDDLCWMDA